MQVRDLTASDRLELEECAKALEFTLDRLDHIGAGIAAIHVNAAIEQLQGNLKALRQSEGGGFDPDLICVTSIEAQLH